MSCFQKAQLAIPVKHLLCEKQSKASSTQGRDTRQLLPALPTEVGRVTTLPDEGTASDVFAVMRLGLELRKHAVDTEFRIKDDAIWLQRQSLFLGQVKSQPQKAKETGPVRPQGPAAPQQPLSSPPSPAPAALRGQPCSSALTPSLWQGPSLGGLLRTYLRQSQCPH